MYLGDLMRRDTILLHLLAVAGGPVGSSELSDALAEAGIDAETRNIVRDLRIMQERALVSFVGFSTRNAARMRLYVLSDLGRATLNRRMAALRSLVLEPPAVRDVQATQAAAGWT